MLLVADLERPHMMRDWVGTVTMEHPSHEELAALVAGDLSDDVADSLAEHVESCSDCREAVGQLGTMPEILEAVGSPFAAKAEEQEFDVSKHARMLRQTAERASDADAQAYEEAAAQALVGTKIRDYDLLELIAIGGMGAVYKARHTGLDRLRAVKLLTPDRAPNEAAVSRFKREWQAAASLDHPNIVRAHDAGDADGTLFLAMEFINGVDLSTLVHRIGPLPVCEACELVRQAAMGLQHAHESGLVHRDIKPSNLILAHPASSSDSAREPDAVVKILDFGLARLHNGQQIDLTSTGQMMGTIDYMAPEQTEGGEVDIRADIYSLGATLYKLLCGRAPYEDASTAAKKLAALERDPIPPLAALRADIEHDLLDLLDQMLAKDPSGRIAEPNEVAERLERFAEGADLAGLLLRNDATSSKTVVLARDVNTDEYLSSSLVDTQSDVEKVQRPAASLERTTLSRHRVRSFIALAIMAVGLALAAIVVRLATDKGEITIKAYDPAIEIEILRNQKPIDGFRVDQRNGATSYFSGSYEIRFKGERPAGVLITNETFQLTRHDEIVVEITRQDVAPTDDAVSRPLTASHEGSSRIDRPLSGIGDEELRKMIQAAPDMTELDLSPSHVTGAGLAELAKLRRLQKLSLDSPLVMDHDVQHLKPLRYLTELRVNCRMISDSFLTDLPTMRNLRVLSLRDTAVSDAALAHMMEFENLQTLDVSGTFITQQGVESLAQSLPDCTIERDGSVNPHRELADWLLAKGFRLQIKSGDQPVVERTQDLPLIPFIVQTIWLQNQDEITSQLLSDLTDLMSGIFASDGIYLSEMLIEPGALAELDGLLINELSLRGTSVTDADLKALANIRIVHHLDLSNTEITDDAMRYVAKSGTAGLVISSTAVGDEGLRHLQALQNLDSINVHRTPITDRGLEYLAVHKGMRTLLLGAHPRVTDTGMKVIGQLSALERLEISNVPIGDEGVRQLAKLSNLTTLSLTSTKATDEGVRVILESNPKLRNLGLTNSGGVNGSCFRGIGESLQVTDLALAQTSVDDAGLSWIAEIRQLKRLEINSTPVKGPGLVHLAQLGELEELVLSGTSVADEHLGHLYKIKTLRSLSLNATNVTAEGIARLKEALPNCDVSWSDPESN